MLKSFLSKVPRFFSVFFVLFFATAFFVLADSFRIYRAEAELVVVSRATAISTSVAAETIAALPSTLSFYDRLLSDHERIEDPWTEESRVGRKEAWARVVSARVMPGTSLVRLSILSPDPEQSAALLNASIETLYGFSGRLYDRNEQVDVRLVEGVLVRPVFRQMGVLVLISALLAGMLAYLASRVLGLSFRGFSLPSFRAGMLSRAQRAAKSLQPVGSFPDLPSAYSGRSDALTDVPQNISSDSVEQEQVALQEESKVSEVPNSFPLEVPTETPVSFSGDVVNKESNESASVSAEPQTSAGERAEETHEPHDIWEKSSHLSRGPLRIRTVKPKSSEFEETPIRGGESTPSSPTLPSGRGGVRRHVPGNLDTVSARDFSWEKYLFQNGQTDSEADTVETSGTSPETSSEGVVSEKREPSPEELKARLNQLLRGEL